MSSVVNKVKEAMHSDKKTSEPEGTHGPHSSRMANTADPRIDSDRDHRAARDLTGSGTYGTTGTTGTTGNYTTSTTGARIGNDGPAPNTDGPHKSDMMNKMDPRVDSDRDYSRNMGANPKGTSGTGAYNAGSTTTTTGAYNTSTSKSGVPEGTFGPHSSRAANAADPRVDSDLDNTRSMGTRGTTGATGTYGSSELHTHSGNPELHSSSIPEGTFGPHSSRAANAADPRVDSDLDNTRTMGTRGTTTGRTGGIGGSVGGTGGAYGATSTTGPAPTTAGPHKSDMMNKMDPRVDSDLDGSKTFGGDKTYNQSNTYAAKDPTDAAQVPPSVLQKHIGAPSIAHDDHEHDRERRHSVSHQTQHRGL